MPKISVIVPVYNVEPYIHKCVDSILCQTFTDFELILVDDGSPDNCGKICDEYAKKDDRIIVIHKENGGVSRARNTGIDAATGEYIAFIDSDDYVDPDFLKNYADAISGNNPDIIHSGLRYMPSGRELVEKFPTGKVLSGVEMIENAPNISKDISISFSVRYCFKNKFLKENCLKFNNTIFFGEDTCFNLKAVSRAKTMLCTDSITYNYLYRENSATSKYKPTMVRDLDYLYTQQKSVIPLLKNSRFEYTVDITEKHINYWIPSCVDNFKNSAKGFSYKKARDLIKASFVQDGAMFLLKNEIYNRKLQLLYYKAINLNLTLPLYLFLKYGNINEVIG